MNQTARKQQYFVNTHLRTIPTGFSWVSGWPLGTLERSKQNDAVVDLLHYDMQTKESVDYGPHLSATFPFWSWAASFAFWALNQMVVDAL